MHLLNSILGQAKKSQEIAPTQRYLNDGYKTKPVFLNVNDKKRKLVAMQMCSH